MTEQRLNELLEFLHELSVDFYREGEGADAAKLDEISEYLEKTRKSKP